MLLMIGEVISAQIGKHAKMILAPLLLVFINKRLIYFCSPKYKTLKSKYCTKVCFFLFVL